jgi:hypothetical protein
MYLSTPQRSESKVFNVLTVVAGIETMVRMSSWERREEESGNKNKRPFGDWQGVTWHVFLAVLLIPSFKSCFFSHAVLPAFTDNVAHRPPETMLKNTAKEIIVIKSLFLIQYVYL